MLDQDRPRGSDDPRASTLRLATPRAQPAPVAPTATLSLEGSDPAGPRALRQPLPSVPADPAKVAKLIADFDALFAGVWPGRLRELFAPDDPRPLAIGIGDAIAAAAGLDGDGRRRLGRLLGAWTRRGRYLKALRTEGAMRHGLDGLPVGPVSREDALSAMHRRYQMSLRQDRWLARQDAIAGKKERE